MSDPASPLFRGPGSPATKKGDEDLPEPLRGKSPKEILEIMKAEHIREMAEQQTEYAQKLEQLALTPPAMPQAPQPQPQPQGQAPAPVEFDISNPDAYLEQQLNRRLAPLVQSFVASGRQTAKEVASNKFKDDLIFTKYRDDIEKFMDALSPQMQTNPQMYEVAVNYVRGQHVDELVEEKTKTSVSAAVKQALVELGYDQDELAQREAARASAQPAAPSRPSLFSTRSVPPVSTPRAAGSANGGSTGPKLSAAEKTMCEKFNMTPEEYLHFKTMNSDILSVTGRSLE